MKVDYRIGEMYAPLTDSTEALGCLTNHFRNCIEGKEKPITSSTSGLKVVQEMEAVCRSLANNGVPENLQ